MPDSAPTPGARRSRSLQDIGQRRDGPNITLAKSMGSTRGYDPIPPAQYEWQIAEHEPPIYRMWSWFCMHTIARGRMSPFAVKADGTAATLKDCARDLGLDLAQVSNLFKFGAQKGLWRKKGGRELYFSGEVTREQVAAANKKRKVECTLNLSPRDLLIIKTWPTDKQAEFTRIWEAAQSHHQADLAAAVAVHRKTHARVDDTIRNAFALPEKRRKDEDSPQTIEVPEVIKPYWLSVQQVPVRSTGAECTPGETVGENVSVQSAASLLPSEKKKEGVPASASIVLEHEAAQLAAALQIDDDGARFILSEVRKTAPSITWRECVELAHMKLKQQKPTRSVVGLLAKALPLVARGSMLARARMDAERAAIAAGGDPVIDELRRANTLKDAQATLDDPASSDSDREIAQFLIDGNTRSASA